MLAEKCLRLAEDTGTRKNIVKARRLRGHARLRLGNLSGSEQDLSLALELALDIGNAGQTWRTHEAIGDLCSAQGLAEEARSAYARAVSVIDEIASSLRDDELRSNLLRSAAADRLRRQSA
jgi:predicted negative regulator of RcsB-dependent stress response